MTTTPIVLSKTYVDGAWVTYYPQTSAAAIITDANGRLVTDTQISAWDSKAEAAAVAQTLTDAKSYTDTKVAALVDGAPEALDTLSELATALQSIEGSYEGLLSVIGEKATKTELTSGLALKADKTELTVLATKTEVTEGLALKADLTAIADMATKTDMTAKLALKADLTAIADMATNTAVNASLETKANKADVVNVTLGKTAPLESKEGDFFFEIISPVA